MSGFVKIARKVLEWEWYTDANVKLLFLHLLLKANWKDGRFQGHEVPRGSLVTSVGTLCNEIGLTTQQVRTALKKLQSTEEITSKAQGKFSIISITNYAQYQDEQQTDNNQSTNDQQSFNKPLTTLEEVKKLRKKEEENKYFLHGAPQADSVPPLVADAVITLPLNAKGQEHAVTQADVDEWQALYPAVDVMQELRNAKGWLIGNPSRRKTKSGIGKFLHSWLAKAQNQGGTQNLAPAKARPMTKRDELIQSRDNMAASVAARRGIDLHALLGNTDGNTQGAHGMPRRCFDELPSGECDARAMHKHDGAVVGRLSAI